MWVPFVSEPPLEEELIEIEPEFSDEWKQTCAGFNAQSRQERQDEVNSTAKLTEFITRSVQLTGTAELWAYEGSLEAPTIVDFDIREFETRLFFVTDGFFYRFFDGGVTT